ncbi:ABC transporter ATPase [Polaribacter sp.]|nr:ABC transporter ATPase [Polaribacter sp.]
MLVVSSDISEQAKTLIYPSSRKFYKNEIKTVQEKVNDFLNGFLEKKTGLKVSFQFLYNRFLIFFIDDSNSSLKHDQLNAIAVFIQKLEKNYDVTLLDRMNICFKQGEYVQYKELKDLKSLLKNKALTGKSIVFDNTIDIKKDFDEFWETTLENSWYNRFL